MRILNALSSALLFSATASAQVLPLDINGERYAIDCNDNECSAFSSAQIVEHGLVAESLIYTSGKKFILYKNSHENYCINVGTLARFQDYVVKAGRAAFKMNSLLNGQGCPSNGIELNVDDTKTAFSGKNVSIFISGEYSPVEWERRLTDKENARLQVRGNELYLDTKPLEGYLEFTQVKKTEIR